MCVFSMCCRNVSAIVPDMGQPIETPFSGCIYCFEKRSSFI